MRRHTYLDIAVTFFAFGLLTGVIVTTAASCQPTPNTHITGGHQ